MKQESAIAVKFVFLFTETFQLALKQ